MTRIPDAIEGPSYFMVLCHYTDSAALEEHYADHVEWVERHAASGSILLAGGSPQRDKGAILARCSSREILDKMLREDSFSQAGIATYEVVEFIGRRGSAARQLAQCDPT